VPTRSPELSQYGFKLNIGTSYSILCQKHCLLGNLIRLHRGETPLDSRSSKHFVVPEASFPHKARRVHIANHGVIPMFHTPQKRWNPHQTRATSNGLRRFRYLSRTSPRFRVGASTSTLRGFSSSDHEIQSNLPKPVREGGARALNR
jgi:hypothetical protein